MTTCRGGEESVATHQADMNFREKMMKDPVKKWHDEHARFSRLLDYLDAQMAAIPITT
jgi:hypothetical protein